MWRKILGYLLIVGSAGIVALAVAIFLDPGAGIWQSIGPLFLALLFFIQGQAYLSTAKPVLATRRSESNLQGKDTGNTLAKLTAAIPRCLAGFEVRDGSAYFTGTRYSGPHFVIKQVSCSCGSQTLDLLATPTSDGEYLAPIYLRCSVCSSRQLLFDPTIHGWDGEGGMSASRVGQAEPRVVGSSPGAAIVVYSYQGIENYDDLIEGGVANPEDYFDTFAVYFAEPGGEPVRVVSYECA